MQDVVKTVKKDKNIDDVDVNRVPKNKSKKLWVFVVVLMLAALVGAVGWLYKENRDLRANPAAAQTEKNKAETARVLDNLKSSLLITEAEAPTVARVEDPAKLQQSNKEFYKNVQKGDYLVIYPKRAIVYRESNRQIINVAPIINTSDIKTDQGTKPAETTTPATTTKKN